MKPKMSNKTLGIFVFVALATSFALAAVNGVFNHVKAFDYAIGSNVVIPNSTTGFTGTGTVVLSASPALTGVPTVPTAAPGTNTTQAASTAFVIANAGALTTTCNPNGCYYQLADGTYVAWGITTAATGGASNELLTATYPVTFVSAPAPEVSPIASPNGGAGPCAGFSCPVSCNAVRTSLSTTGVSVSIFIPTQVGGSGFSSIAAGDYCRWVAIGK